MEIFFPQPVSVTTSITRPPNWSQGGGGTRQQFPGAEIQRGPELWQQIEPQASLNCRGSENWPREGTTVWEVEPAFLLPPLPWGTYCTSKDGNIPVMFRVFTLLLPPVYSDPSLGKH